MPPKQTKRAIDFKLSPYSQQDLERLHPTFAVAVGNLATNNDVIGGYQNPIRSVEAFVAAKSK
jgi:hypothetical protein